MPLHELERLAGALLENGEFGGMRREAHVVAVGGDEGLDTFLAFLAGEEVREAGPDDL